jgi:uncharacterized protein YeaO (DUF488 family)
VLGVPRPHAEDIWFHGKTTTALPQWLKGLAYGDRHIKVLASTQLDGFQLIKVKRVYEPPSEDDGLRVLVDRLWPRGLSRESAKVDLWLRDAAPSDELRRWFNHDPSRWDEFKSRYFEELRGNRAVDQLLEVLRSGRTITLLYAARSPYNNAVALKEYLESLLAKG